MSEDLLPTILVFSDDWGRHPSSCQHLILRLLPRYRVLWVNTIGTRAPQWTVATQCRAFEKLGQWFRPAPAEAAPPHLRILNPKMWPWLRMAPFDRGLNRRLLARQLRPHLESLRPPAVAVTTVPVVADLVGQLPVRHWLYYCVDDFSKWPGLDQAALDRLEHALADRVDSCIAVSATLQDRLAGMGRTSSLLTHGVDLAFWSAPANPKDLPQLAGMEKPWIVFWGLKDRRLDLEVLTAVLAHDLSRGQSCAGRAASGSRPNRARHAAGSLYLPVLDYDDLPHLGQQAAVLVMPYADLPVTRAMQPLKLKEYLATGRPVVARSLPALQEWHDCLDLVDTPEAFARAVRLRIREGLPAAQHAARARLAAERLGTPRRSCSSVLSFAPADAPAGWRHADSFRPCQSNWRSWSTLAW